MERGGKEMEEHGGESSQQRLGNMQNYLTAIDSEK